VIHAHTYNNNWIGFNVVGMDGEIPLFEQCPVCGRCRRISSLKEPHMTQLGKPYSELPHTGLGASLQHPVCQGWREREHLARRPSGLEDFYRAHGLCYSW